ncbi:MAG: efflux RND transporter periplasmic adaptor subunit [candidate division NC10 bacterium]|nr:efflux RND transporter periplasmic adaptor subunit [candidate division NC10 bacterium]
MSKSVSKVLSIGACVLTVVIAFSLYCLVAKHALHKGSEEASAPPPAMAKPATTPGEVCLPPDSVKFLDLTVEKALRKDLALGVPTVGKVLEDQSRSAHIRSLIPGTLSQVLIKLGDRVSKGQTLFYLASIEVGKAKSEYLKAKIDLEFALANLERQRRLFEAKVASKRSVQEAETSYQTALANLTAAHRALHIFGLSDSEIEVLTQSSQAPHELTPIIPIRAPIAGTVVEMGVHLGERVAPEDELCRIVDLSSVCIDAHVFEKSLPQIRVGQKVMISLPAYPHQIFLGRVKYIGDILEKETGTYIVRTLVSNSDCKLKPGMSASIHVLTGNRKALVVPKEAILEEGNERYVFCKSDHSFCKHLVETGLTSDGFTEILSGLQEGDEVVVKGNFLLKSELAKGSLEEQRGH